MNEVNWKMSLFNMAKSTLMKNHEASHTLPGHLSREAMHVFIREGDEEEGEDILIAVEDNSRVACVCV